VVVVVLCLMLIVADALSLDLARLARVFAVKRFQIGERPLNVFACRP
jgi:hypothetical protein